MNKGEGRIAGSGAGDLAAVEQEIGQIARGAGVGLGGNAVNTAVSYLFGILVARQIGADQYGLYTLAVTAVTLVSRFTITGLDRGLLRFASISRSQGQGQLLHRLIAIALGIGAVVGLAG
ncbi:MAG: oligosaccharide flippase family protein, partial [Caldilineales bacterium]|nr:oligosaccharide flippase family protein [Caldilineales bacterium]